MTDQTRGVLDRYGRFLWGGAALLLLLVLLGSVVLPGSSDGGSEADAQARAESLSGSFIEKELSPDLLARDITGAASRHLTVLVQAVIRSDDRFTTVRIWRLDGALIYSTAQGDDTSVIAADDRWIGQALDGQTVSVLSSAGTYHDGLQRPDEELFQTFVPITLSDDGTVDGVVQIDQRSSSIHGQAARIWRPAAARRVPAPHRRRRDVRPVAAPGSGEPRARTTRTPGRARSPRRGSRRPGSSRPGRARGARDPGASARAGGGPRGRADHRGARGARPQAPRLGGRARGARGHHPAAPGDPVRARHGRRARARRLRLEGRHEADQPADRRRGEQGRRSRTQGRRRGEEEPGGGEAGHRHRRAGARDGGPAQGGGAEGGRRPEARGQGGQAGIRGREEVRGSRTPCPGGAAEGQGGRGACHPGGEAGARALGNGGRGREASRRERAACRGGRAEGRRRRAEGRRDGAARHEPRLGRSQIAAKLKRTEDERDQLMARLGNSSTRPRRCRPHLRRATARSEDRGARKRLSRRRRRAPTSAGVVREHPGRADRPSSSDSSGRDRLGRPPFAPTSSRSGSTA